MRQDLRDHSASPEREAGCIVAATVETICRSLCGSRPAELDEGPASQMIQAAVTRIYEACTFQDIAGQRIAKVIKTLKMIDAKITGLINNAMPGEVREESPEEGQGLLNGPALHNGLSQDDIDRLLEGL